MRASITWRWLLRTGLATGGVVDLALATALLGACGPPAIELFGARRPHSFYPGWTDSPEAAMAGLLLAALGLVCLAAANDPRRYAANVTIAGSLRLALALVLAFAARDGGGAALGALAGLELVLGLTHLVPSWRLGR